MFDISYIKEGQGETVLFLHGWGQSKEMMIPIIEELKNKYECVLIDLPGFGNSNFNNADDIDEYVELIRNFLNENNILPKFIVGHSFGGKIALHYYLKYKDIGKLVIIASPLLKPKRDIKYYYKITKYKVMKKLKIKNIKGGSSDYNNCSLDMRKFFVKVVNTHYNKKIKEIEIPTLLIWGNDDKQVPINKAKKLHKLIKNNQLYILNGGHFAYLENIEFTRLVIQKFLRRL